MRHELFASPGGIVHSLAKVVLSMALISGVLFSGQTGKIAGKISDASNKETLIGASVTIQDTHMGASTDVEGYYYISNVAPGTYVLAISNIGYKKALIRNVVVKIDLTTEIDVKLEHTAVVGTEVIIQAERPLVQKDLTSSSVTVSSDELKMMPVENVQQVINLQAGVVDGHFRGGRRGEVAYLIDGLSINNPANGYAGLTLENASVREMEVISGTFNAEYGQAMSGVVNIVTQDGGSRLHGSVSTYFGDYYTKHSDVFQNLDKLNVSRSKNFQASINGPTLVSDRLTFFLTGRYYDDEGYLYGRRLFNVSDNITPLFDSNGNQLRITDPNQGVPDGYVLSSDDGNLYSFDAAATKKGIFYTTDETGNVYRITKTGDGAYVPMNPSRKYSANGKITYALSDLKFTYGLFWEDNFNKDNYGSNYDHSFKLTPDGLNNYYSRSYIHSFQISHVPSQSTFQTLKFSVNVFKSHRNVFDNPYDMSYVDPTQGTPKTSYTFRSGGNDAGRDSVRTQSIIGQWSLSSQLTKEHKIGIGIEGRTHQLFRHDKTLTNITKDLIDSTTGFPVFTRGYPNLGTIVDPTTFNQMYDKRPFEASGYIQDKMEYGDMIINAGVRLDYFNANAKLLADLKNPTRNTLYPSAGKMVKASAKVQVSPRLGVSFPITDEGIIHFSYGHFFQIPTFENLYYNSDFLITPGQSLNSRTGNPDLDAQRTISYELGLQQALFTNIGIDFTVYYRDIRNLLGTEIIETYEGFKYARFINRDYGNTRGFVLSLDRRFANYFSLRADYTYQIAEGDASDPLQNYYNNQSNPPVETNKSVVPLSWDQRSTLNLNLTVGEINDWTVGLIFQYGVGFPYTPDTRISLLRFENGALKPSTNSLDLRAEKNLSLGDIRFSLFLLIYNLLDVKNEKNVNSASGRANVDIFTSQNAQKIIGLNTIQENQNNPGNFSTPRQVRVGFNLGF
jgi:outer membrane receptor protein involved in Fe transport